MILGDDDRYPETQWPDPFVVAARALCGERESVFGWRHRRHPLDVARDQLIYDIRNTFFKHRFAWEVGWECGRR